MGPFYRFTIVVKVCYDSLLSLAGKTVKSRKRKLNWEACKIFTLLSYARKTHINIFSDIERFCWYSIIYYRASFFPQKMSIQKKCSNPEKYFGTWKSTFWSGIWKNSKREPANFPGSNSECGNFKFRKFSGCFCGKHCYPTRNMRVITQNLEF